MTQWWVHVRDEKKQQTVGEDEVVERQKRKDRIVEEREHQTGELVIHSWRKEGETGG